MVEERFLAVWCEQLELMWDQTVNQTRVWTELTP